MGALLGWLFRFGPWLRGLLPALFRMGLKFYTAWTAISFGKRLLVIGLLGAFFPVPEWAQELPGKVQALPEPFWFFANLIQLQFGIYVLMSAYTFRWVWKAATSQA